MFQILALILEQRKTSIKFAVFAMNATIMFTRRMLVNLMLSKTNSLLLPLNVPLSFDKLLKRLFYISKKRCFQTIGHHPEGLQSYLRLFYLKTQMIQLTPTTMRVAATATYLVQVKIFKGIRKNL